jgi:FMN phosphatase YigB (HAD superfamily)
MSDVLLFDVMDTLVRDPFWSVYPDVLGMDGDELRARKRDDVWPDFERGRIDEAALAATYFRDGAVLDVEALKTAMFSAYEWMPGAQGLLVELRDLGVEMHVMSNYPVWYEQVEDRLGLSRYLPWSFVSWHTGHRKPEPGAFAHVIDTLDIEAARCVLVDDRAVNCQGALEAGMRAIRFEGTPNLRRALASIVGNAVD